MSEPPYVPPLKSPEFRSRADEFDRLIAEGVKDESKRWDSWRKVQGSLARLLRLGIFDDQQTGLPDYDDLTRPGRVTIIDLSDTGTQAFSVFVRVDDRRPDPQYKDRYNQTFQLAPLSRRVIRIPVAEIESAPNGSKIDLAHMQSIILFEDGSGPTHPFYLNSLRLER